MSFLRSAHQEEKGAERRALDLRQEETKVKDSLAHSGHRQPKESAKPPVWGPGGSNQDLAKAAIANRKRFFSAAARAKPSLETTRCGIRQMTSEDSHYQGQ